MADRGQADAGSLGIHRVDRFLDLFHQFGRRDAPFAVHQNNFHGSAAVPDRKNFDGSHAGKKFNLVFVVGDIPAERLGFQRFKVAGAKGVVAFFVFAWDQNVGQARGRQFRDVVDREQGSDILVPHSPGRFCC